MKLKSSRGCRIPAAAAVVVFAVCVSVSGVAQCSLLCDLSSSDVTEGDWRVVLNEEFPGNALNASVWTARYSSEVGHLNELEYYVPRNARVQGGSLIIDSDRENYKSKNYTSAWVDTNGKFEALYGRFCVRAIIPADLSGFWPAHWLMPARDHGKTCWPGPGEVDIMEMINGDGTVHGSFHYTAHFKETKECFGPEMSATAVLNYRNMSTFNDVFHEYAVEWNSQSLTYFVDGVKYLSLYPSDSDQDGVPEVPMYVILNSALGGWAHNPTIATKFPIHHTVDYVRVLQSASEPLSRFAFTGGESAVAEGGFSPSMSKVLEQRSRWMRERGGKSRV